MPALRVNAETISLHSLIQRARMRGQLQFIDDAINEAIVRDAAFQLEIDVTRDEIQEAANEFREKHNLLKSHDAMRWLEERGLSVAEWQSALEEDVLVAKFKKARFEPRAESYFAEHKLEFDTATISRLSTMKEGLASELALQIREEGAVFEDIARKFSSDIRTRETGGFVGKVTRRDLGPAASSAVFGGAAGSVHGPFKSGKEYQLLRVIALHPAEFDDATKKEVIERMFRDWLTEARSKSRIEMPLFDSATAVVESR